MSFRRVVPLDVPAPAHLVLYRGLRGTAREFRLRPLRAHHFKEDTAIGLQVPNDEPENKPMPPSTESVFRKRHLRKPTFRYPIIALDPEFKPPNKEFEHFKPPAEYFPQTAEEAGLPMMDFLNHRDMWLRKQKLDIPFFCAGCYMAVTCGDPNHPLGVSRFVGICTQIHFKNHGTTFHVANVIEGMPVKKQYDLYGPFLQKIEVLKAERRNRQRMNWLFKQKHPRHFTIPEDMKDENPPDRDPYDPDVPFHGYVDYEDKPKFE
eukprot:scpid87854/ scgid19399/ 39S ribosomal protein L19, mitochondrial